MSEARLSSLKLFFSPKNVHFRLFILFSTYFSMRKKVFIFLMQFLRIHNKAEQCWNSFSQIKLNFQKHVKRKATIELKFQIFRRFFLLFSILLEPRLSRHHHVYVKIKQCEIKDEVYISKSQLADSKFKLKLNSLHWHYKDKFWNAGMNFSLNVLLQLLQWKKFLFLSWALSLIQLNNTFSAYFSFNFISINLRKCLMSAKWYIAFVFSYFISTSE
jgi:hypothetical protein